MADTWQVDRSGILEFQKCPRSRFYSRHFNGDGIARTRKSLPLVFGSAFHAGAEGLLSGDIEKAVADALDYIDNAFAASTVDLEEKETAYAIDEQRAIAEGLLRGWWAFNGERFLADFEVIEVEREGRAELAPGMVLMFRPDALVRERASGDFYIVSWKTASTFGQYTINQISTDMQSMSEVWGVQTDNNKDSAPDEQLRIEGVLYLFAVKGQRKLDDYLGFKVQNTPLAYGWKRDGPTPEETEWAHCYGWATEEVNPKTGKNVQTKLGKGFRKVLVADAYPGGVKAWIDALAKQEITPRHVNALEAIFPQSMPVSRRDDEIESWLRQTVAQEKRIQDDVVRVQAGAVDSADEAAMLDTYFPQHTARCFDYMSKCAFYDCCFTPAVKADPLTSSLYQIRVANHPEKGDAE
jgi:hypothetical protein